MVSRPGPLVLALERKDTTMTSISSIGSAWSHASLQQRSGGQQRLLSRLDTDQSGGVDGTELQSMIDGVAQKTGLSLDTSAEDMLAQYDADGDGQLSQAEFDAGRPSGQEPGMAGGMPPPPPGGPGGPGGAQQSGGSSATTTYDPLDTNEDGTVSLAERLAGSSSAQEAAQALFAAIDTDGDKTLSETEAQTFIDQLTEAATQAGIGTQQGTPASLVQLAEQARRAYEAIAANSSAAAASSNNNSVSALA